MLQSFGQRNSLPQMPQVQQQTSTASPRLWWGILVFFFFCEITRRDWLSIAGVPGWFCWYLMDIYGYYIRIFMDIYGYSWIFMDIFMDFPCAQLLFLWFWWLITTSPMVTLMPILSNRVSSPHQVESLVDAADAAPSGVTDAVEDGWWPQTQPRRSGFSKP